MSNKLDSSDLIMENVCEAKENISEKKTFKEKFMELNASFAKKTTASRKTTEHTIVQTFFPIIVYLCFFNILSASVFFLLFCRIYLYFNFFILFEQLVLFSIPSLMLSAFIFIFPKRAQLVIFPLTSIVLLVYSIAQLCVVDQIGSMFRLATIATLGNATGFAFGSLKELDYLVWIMIGLTLAVLIAMEILIAKKYIPSPPFNQKA